MMKIPKPLIDQIKSGNVVLFLGAGASYGAAHPESKQIPLGNVLSDMLVDKFLTDDYKGQPLQYVAEITISEYNIYDLQKYIYDVFEPFQPSATHKKIPKFIWKSIITTNYDFIVERAYSSTKSLQKLSTFIKNGERVRDKIISNKDLSYYKIHGCISDINDINTPLILTPEQYITHRNNRDRLFTRIQEYAYEYTFLFVGFSFADPDIRTILLELDKLKDGKPRSYMVGPHFKEQEVRLWEGKKVTAIKASFDDFLCELENEISDNQNNLALIKIDNEIHKIFDKAVINTVNLIPSDSLLNLLNNEVEYIHGNLKSPNTDPKEFYKGYFVNWDPIIKNYDSKRSIHDNILYEVFLKNEKHLKDDVHFYMLLGHAGSGKSVSLKRICWEAANEVERICLYLKPNSILRAEPIIELYNYLKERIYIFVDDVLDVKDEMLSFISKIEKEKIPITIIGAERVNTWNTQCVELSLKINDDYRLEYLNDKEIKGLLEKLDKYDSLGYLKDKSEDERIESLSYKAGRELLVALYESTMGKPFKDIVVDEFNSIPDDTAKSIYLTVSILHRLGTQARAGLISRVHDISFSSFKEKLFKPLEFIVFDKIDNRISDIVYITRHRQIAEIVFSEILKNKQAKFDEYLRILSCLDVDYENDRIAFLSMINAKNLMDLFSDPNMIREIYNTAIERNSRDPKLLQQFAIFEMNGNGGNINESESLLLEAKSLTKNDLVIHHSFIELSITKAEKSKSKLERNKNLNDAQKLANELISKNKDNPHAYHSLIKVYLIRLKEIIEGDDAPSIERYIKEIEETFNLARQRFPHQEFILEAESKFNKILNNSPKAISLLEKAYSINKRSPYLCLRLADLYERNNNEKDAFSTLEETLKLIPNDKDVNYKYSMLLLKYKSDDLSNIKYHLGRSFTKGDNRIQAQFWYARTVYLMNGIDEASKIFIELSGVKITPNLKSVPRGKVRIKGDLQIFKGTIVSVESKYGFIRRDGMSDTIYFYRYENSKYEYFWSRLKKDTRVSFVLAFNYNGPIAINVKIE